MLCNICFLGRRRIVIEVNFWFQIFWRGYSARNGKRSKYCSWGTLGNIYSGWEKKHQKTVLLLTKLDRVR